MDALKGHGKHFDFYSDSILLDSIDMAKECHDVTYILKGLLQLVGREQTVERDRQSRETHWEFITIAWLRNNGGLGQGDGSEVGEKS